MKVLNLLSFTELLCKFMGAFMMTLEQKRQLSTLRKSNLQEKRKYPKMV